MIPDSILQRVPGASRRVAALPGGRHNRLFRIDSDAGSFVLRQPLEPVAPPGVDRQREALIQGAAAAVGLAPRILAGDADSGWLLMVHAPGDLWNAADFAARPTLLRLGERLALLHGLPVVPCALFDAMTIAQDQVARIDAAQPQAGNDFAPVLTELHALGLRLADLGRGAVMNHGDLDAANLVGPQPLLIDWEYAQLADPLYDIACILGYYPAARAHTAELLAAAGLGDPQSARALPWQQRQFDLLNLLWQRAAQLYG